MARASLHLPRPPAARRSSARATTWSSRRCWPRPRWAWAPAPAWRPRSQPARSAASCRRPAAAANNGGAGPRTRPAAAAAAAAAGAERARPPPLPSPLQVGTLDPKSVAVHIASIQKAITAPQVTAAEPAVWATQLLCLLAPKYPPTGAPSSPNKPPPRPPPPPTHPTTNPPTTTPTHPAAAPPAERAVHRGGPGRLPRPQACGVQLGGRAALLRGLRQARHLHRLAGAGCAALGWVVRAGWCGLGRSVGSKRSGSAVCTV
jgi:hypothetical protein